MESLPKWLFIDYNFVDRQPVRFMPVSVWRTARESRVSCGNETNVGQCFRYELAKHTFPPSAKATLACDRQIVVACSSVTPETPGDEEGRGGMGALTVVFRFFSGSFDGHRTRGERYGRTIPVPYEP